MFMPETFRRGVYGGSVLPFLTVDFLVFSGPPPVKLPVPAYLGV
jgi:hypothetical protein